MSDKYISIDLDDPRAGKIAEVISNKTSKKILSLLAEGEVSESEIANKLNVPLNTVDYNIKKLVESGLIEKCKGFLWSVKGKRIEKYKVSNREILISPRIMARGILPALIGLIVLAGLISVWQSSQNALFSQDNVASGDNALLQGGESAAVAKVSERMDIAGNINNAYVQNINIPEPGIWFLFGGLIALLIVAAWNLWRKE